MQIRLYPGYRVGAIGAAPSSPMLLCPPSWMALVWSVTRMSNPSLDVPTRVSVCGWVRTTGGGIMNAGPRCDARAGDTGAVPAIASHRARPTEPPPPSGLPGGPALMLIAPVTENL